MSELTFDQYPFLKELGIQRENFGSFINGQWIGGGEKIYASSPIDNKVNKFLTLSPAYCQYQVIDPRGI